MFDPLGCLPTFRITGIEGAARRVVLLDQSLSATPVRFTPTLGSNTNPRTTRRPPPTRPATAKAAAAPEQGK
ncbi:hypothetical protein GCM10009854_09170 [Saccharopolyspora halophila]|uniref:Uncharacterized protein n=1 Tax=Saccharopolyspora halophila TaxID=405551 RepID=A0ABP5SNS4_9PSEU